MKRRYLLTRTNGGRELFSAHLCQWPTVSVTLQEQVYKACASIAWLDRPIAHTLMRQAQSVTRDQVSEEHAVIIRVGGDLITLKLD